jgi:hypothetical protein
MTTTRSDPEEADRKAAEEAATILDLQDTDGAYDRPLAGGPTSHPEEAGLLLTPAFSRMRTDWSGPDWEIVRSMHEAVDMVISNTFGDLLEIMLDLYAMVRDVEVGAGGEIVYDESGLPRYRRYPSGAYIEDWTRVTVREQETLIHRITAGLFRWEQEVERLRAEALFGKAQFEEAYSRGYRELKDPKATIDDRTAEGRIRAAEYRYRSVYLSYLSRRAEAAVGSIVRYGQRLKDIRSSP